MGQIIIDKKIYRVSQRDIAKRLGVHYMTVNRWLREGETHPQFKRIIHTVTEMNREIK